MHDIESARVPRGQLSLFAQPTVAEVLMRHGVRHHTVQRLFYDGHLSFEPVPARRLQPADEAELDFLCGLAGMVGTRYLDRLLAPLRAPYAYRLERVSFDFATRGWRFDANPDERCAIASRFDRPPA